MLSQKAPKQSLMATSCTLKQSALSTLLISILVSLAHLYFCLLHAQPAYISISDVLFTASACTASILALVLSQLNKAQIDSRHGMSVFLTVGNTRGPTEFLSKIKLRRI